MNVICGLCDPDTGELRYIGQTRDPKERIRKHLRLARGASQQHVHRWLRKVGRPPLVQVLEANVADLDAAERRWIMWAREHGLKLCNQTDGGESRVGWRHSQATRARLSQAAKVQMADPAARERIAQANRDRVYSAEERRRRSESHRGRKQTEETKRKIGAAHQGMKRSPETRAKIAAAAKRREAIKRGERLAA
ncbi:MAG: GIY-YIG nuclease family protein [Solirubrobacteraceae bacterium]